MADPVDCLYPYFPFFNPFKVLPSANNFRTGKYSKGHDTDVRIAAEDQGRQQRVFAHPAQHHEYPFIKNLFNPNRRTG